MRRAKAWALLAGGALCVLVGIVSVINYAFNAHIGIGAFTIPPGFILAGMFVLGGGCLLASGLIAVDPHDGRK